MIINIALKCVELIVYVIWLLCMEIPLLSQKLCLRCKPESVCIFKKM